jgi:glycopeptide antibiotics resistance protein
MKARSTPYALKPWAMIAYFTLLALTALAFLGWTQPGLRIVDVEVLVPGFYAHTSNLLLSCTLVLVFGLVRLLYGASLWESAAFGGVVIACNFSYELFLTLFNTRDVTDAYFGTLGVVVALGFVALLKRRGLRPTKLSADGAAVADQS